MELTKHSRSGYERKPSSHVVAFADGEEVRFNGRTAWKNYQLAEPQFNEPDRDLMLAAFRRLQIDTQAFRRKRKDDEARFRGQAICCKADWLKQHVEFDGDECLLFPSSVIHRRETVKYNYKTIAAARAMLLMTEGLPKGEGKANMATHICGNGHLSCVNPNHLRWGSGKSNAADAVLHNSPREFVAGMEPETVEAIRQDGRLCNVIAWHHKLPAAIVVGIKTGELWRDAA